VIDESQQVNPDKDLVIYKVLAGKDRRKSGVCTRAEFARWARYEVFQEGAPGSRGASDRRPHLARFGGSANREAGRGYFLPSTPGTSKSRISWRAHSSRAWPAVCAVSCRR